MNGALLQKEAARHPYPLLFATVSGAHLYGFHSADSDYDLRGVHILPNREVLGLEPGQETLERSEWVEGIEVDLVTHDAAKFFRLLLKRNGYVLEQLCSPLVVQSMPEHEELKAIAAGCVTRHHVHHYVGFAANEWKAFQKKRRLKPLLYTYRVLLTGIHLMRTGEVEANLAVLSERYEEPWIKPLLQQKLEGGEKDLVRNGGQGEEEAYLRLSAMLEEAAKRSDLPDESTARPALNDLLIRLRKRYGGEF